MSHLVVRADHEGIECIARVQIRFDNIRVNDLLLRRFLGLLFRNHEMQFAFEADDFLDGDLNKDLILLVDVFQTD